MANSRIARFVTEVAPPQIISVMRRRTSKVLDTISEEERDGSKNEYPASPRSLPSSTTPAPMVVSANSIIERDANQAEQACLEPVRHCRENHLCKPSVLPPICPRSVAHQKIFGIITDAGLELRSLDELRISSAMED
ncbi:hypothetical protein SDJN02_04470, partial [Cucurbita argyrosperma subsp. argyrosperma]